MALYLLHIWCDILKREARSNMERDVSRDLALNSSIMQTTNGQSEIYTVV